MSQYIPQLLTIVGVLVVLVNIIVQVLKPFTEKYFSTNFLAVGVSLILTVAAFFAWTSWKAVPVTWYMVAAAVVVGFLVAYAAMFGFDKLKQAISSPSWGGDSEKAEAAISSPGGGGDDKKAEAAISSPGGGEGDGKEKEALGGIRK